MLRTSIANAKMLKESELQKLAGLLTATNQEQRLEGVKFLKELGGVERLFQTIAFTPEKHNQEDNFRQLIKSIFNTFTGGLDYVYAKTQITCLVYAISVGSLIGVTRALSMGANPNFVLPGGYAALYCCCAAKSSPEDYSKLKKRTSEILAVLKMYKADPNQPAKQDRQYPLTNLLLSTPNDCLIADSEALLDIFPNIDVNVRSATGDSPLFAAAWTGNAKMVARLIKLGANVNAVNHKNYTPLIGAIKSRSWDCALPLLNAGAETNITIKSRGVNGKEVEDSPLTTVIGLYLDANNLSDKRALLNLVKLLLNRGADPYKILDNTFSALTLIIQADSNELFECMVAAGVDFNRVCHTYNKTALMLASQCGRLDMIKRMAATGTDIAHTTLDNRSALFYACFSGKIALVKHLLHPLRAYLNMADKLGFTPLYSAAQAGNTSIVACLLENGAVITAEKENGQTPLHAATKHGHSSTLEVLIAHTKDKEALNAVTQGGATALMTAALYGHLDMVTLLVDGGADPSIKLPFGGNALYIAYDRGHRKICEYLYAQIYYRHLRESGMEVECRLIGKMLSSDNDVSMTFDITYKPTLFAPASDQKPNVGTPKTEPIATDSDVISSFTFLREQGFSVTEIKEMQKKLKQPSQSTSATSTTSPVAEKYTWLQDSINTTSAEVLKVESDQSGNACFIYFDRKSLSEQGCEFTDNLTKIRCKFAPQDNASGIVKLRGKPLEITVQHGNETSQQLLKDEYKFKDTVARVLCYRITSDDGLATLLVGCKYAPNGLHQTSDRLRINNNIITLYLPEAKLSPRKAT